MTNYTSDNGAIAFGDPMDAIRKREEKKDASRIRSTKIRKRKGDIKARKAMHTKFG